MDSRFLESILGMAGLVMLVVAFVIMFQHKIPDEQAYNELTISRSAYLAYQAQYLRAEE